MSLRMKLADWISGGEMTACLSLNEYWQRRARASDIDRYKLRMALARIDKMETPGANATVRRMANTARKALGE